MDPGQWERVDDAFERLLEDKPVDLSSFTTAERELLDRLLESARGDVPALDTPPVDDEALASGLIQSLTEQDEIKPGASIGAFRIVERIGAGGMGVVFMAERIEGGFEQRVALKLLSAADADPVLFRMFLRERALLAQLEHPNIARLIDGGIIKSRRPWFAMEYIDGLPVDDYADRHRLSVEARLELLLQACDALDHAHRRLILHRDIKPGNLLVDSNGTLRLVDFGLGRIFDPDQLSDAQTTIAAGRMTPGFASPEQARGEPITVASEVYQLGLLMHVLLTGAAPYQLEGCSAFEIGRIISEARIRPPSERWCQPGAVERANDMTGERADQLCRRVRGDLDNIVLTALARDPGARYASAAALAEDIRRHLDRIPVRARAATRRYRLTRFIQRNALATGAAATMIAILITSSIVLGYQARELAAERDRVLTESRRAQLEATKANQVSDFLVRLFKSADPAEAMGRQTPVGELLERGEAEIGALDEQPAVQADVLATLAEVNESLGEYQRAGALLEQASATIKRVPEASGTERAQISLARASNFFSQGEYGAAEAIVKQMIENADGVSPDLVDRATTLLADVQQATGRLDAAQATLLGLSEKRPEGAEVRELDAEIARSLAIVHARQSNIDAAIGQFQKALEIRRRLHGERHPETTGALGNLGTALLQAGRIDEGREIVARALEIETGILGPDHPGLAFWLQQLGAASRESGDLEVAAAYLRRALEIRELSLGNDHPETASSRYSLATVLSDLGHHQAALEALNRVQKVRRQLLGEKHPHLANVLHAIGVIECRREQHEQCRESLESALAMRRDLFGEDHMHVADSYLALARLARDQGDPPQARRLLADAERIARRNIDDQHPFFDAILELAGTLDES